MPLETLDIKEYLKTNTVIKEWDNTLPVLLYHGISMSCEDDVMLNLKKVITQVGQDAGKDLHVECIIEGVKGFGERFTSIFGSMTKQGDDYCKWIKDHPVYGKSDFHLVGLSQGGIMARDTIQRCDLGEHKVVNFLSLGGP